MFAPQPDSFLYELSCEEKQLSRILIASASRQHQHRIKQFLNDTGYTYPSCVASFSDALSHLEYELYTHLICTTDLNDVQPQLFVTKAKEQQSGLQCVAISADPDVDEMFDLLIAKAKAYTAIPENPEDLDRIIAFATKGLTIPPSLLKRQNRRQAIFAAVLTHLDLLAEAKSQVRVDPAMGEYLPSLYAALGSSVEIAIQLMRVDVVDYLQLLESALIKRGGTETDPLAKLKERLSYYRQQ